MWYNFLGHLKCLFGYHDPHMAMSFKTGHWQTNCRRCGKTLEKG